MFEGQTGSSGERSDGPDRSGEGEAGFALVLTLVALVGFTVLATGALWMTDGDLRSSEAYSDNRQAFYAADAGMAQFLSTTSGIPPASITYDFGDGASALVTAARIHSDSAAVYHIQSRGSYASPRGDSAFRTLGTLAMIDGFVSAPGSAFSSPSGFHLNGAAATISGFDAATPGSCSSAGTASTNGVEVPPGGYTQNGGAMVPAGNPDGIHEVDQDQLLQEAADFLDALGIDWQQVADNDGATLPAGRITISETDPWPDYDSPTMSEYPVTYVDIDRDETFDAGSNGGRGVLVVPGNLIMSGSFEWDGIILAGGTIRSNGNTTVLGAVMSALNLLIDPDAVESFDLGNGTKTFQFHSCHFQGSVASISGLSRLPGAWYEDF